MSRPEHSAPHGCRECRSLHCPIGDVYATVEDEKDRGKWRWVTVEQAVSTSLKARGSRCACTCHGGTR